MSALVVVALASLVALATAVPASILQDIGDAFMKETMVVAQPVLETVVNISYSQCDNMKKLLGVDYTQMERMEPDLNQLTLKYVTRDLNISLNINAAAKLLPKSPEFHAEHFVIYIHGFTDDPSKSSFATISNGFYSRGIYNILALDGSSLIRWFYLRSTTYVRFMGAKLGSILAQLVKDGLPASSIHLIGHSLGAHISGITGKHFRNLTGQRVGRISGLDPAGPCFTQPDSEQMLGPDDADFVDVIHTDAGVFGIKDPVGQVDYYPNEGREQVGCAVTTCNHGRAWQLFGESLLNDKAFPAAQCDSWDQFKKGNCSGTSYMGIASQSGTTGRFYLQTGSVSPYGLGEKGAKYENNEAFVNIPWLELGKI